MSGFTQEENNRVSCVRKEIAMSDGTPVVIHQWKHASPQALLFIVHGMAEHGRRYNRLAERALKHGCEVWAPDHRAHGDTADAQGLPLGHPGDEDTWNRMLNDVVETLGEAKKLGVPVIMLGHSMGSFVVQCLLTRKERLCDAVMLSGSDAPGGILLSVGTWLARLERKRLGKTGHSMIIHTLSFASFNNAFKPARTPFDWLSRDPQEVDKYISDPKCGFHMTTQFWVDFTHALDVLSGTSFSKENSEMPVHLFAGDKDPVGRFSLGMKELKERFLRDGFSRVELKFYGQSRHETLNDLDRDQVETDVLAFIEQASKKH